MSEAPRPVLWCDGAHPPAENMRRDAALLAAASSDPSFEVVVRLFRFAPPGVTLGANQRPGRELDPGRLAALGATWAARPTGGRAIWHDEEWTFSLACRLGPAGWAATAAGAYERTARLFAQALRSLGVPVALSPGSARGVGAPRAGGGPAAPCFASTARHELTLEGRKFAGIAQRESGGALLQQGSLLLGDSHLRLADVLPLGEEARERVRAAMREGTAHAGPWLAPDEPLERLAGALASLLPDARRVDGGADPFAIPRAGGGRP